MRTGISVLGSHQHSHGPLARVLLLALIAAILAFIDSQYFATFTSPTGFRPSLIRVALLLGAMLCLAALYAEGAVSAGPARRSRWRGRFLIVVLCIVALWVCRTLLHLLEPFLPATTPALGSMVHPIFYPVLGIKIDVTEATVALLLVLYFLAGMFLAVFLPACILRLGARGATGRSWLAFSRHWLAIGVRALVMVPIAFISVPALSYWQVDTWQQSPGTPPEQTDAILFATLMCETVGPAGIAYSAFGGTLLFGLFLWWIGHATGVRLDRPD
jgi:hypothetical protein